LKSRNKISPVKQRRRDGEKALKRGGID